jgi:hypothetical protein
MTICLQGPESKLKLLDYQIDTKSLKSQNSTFYNILAPQKGTQENYGLLVGLRKFYFVRNDKI